MRYNSRHSIVTFVLAASILFAATAAGAASLAVKDVMKKMGAAAAAEDAKLLAPLFAETLALKPNDPELAAWTAIVEKGKAAAERGDLAAAKATCKDCHSQLRDKYKMKYGSKAP